VSTVTDARSRLKIPVLVLLTVALLWLVLVRGYADYLARFQPQRAIGIQSSQPEALIRLAESALVAEDLPLAQSLARRAVTSAPLEGRGFRILGAVADLRGDSGLATALMNVAAQLSPRDAPTQFWLVLRAIQAQDIDGALVRVDRLLRFQPEALDRIMPLLTTFASNPVSAPRFSKVLAQDPPWRANFFARLMQLAPTTTHLSMFVQSLRRVGSDLAPSERKNWIDRLSRDLDWPRLRRELARDQLASAGTLLRDGDFESDADMAFAGWRLAQSTGLEVMRVAREDSAKNRALRLEFFGSRVRIQGIEQWTLLEPGRYRLSAQVRLENLQTPRGLMWSVHCIPAAARPLGESELLLGERAWSTFSFDFEVPAAGCGAQRLNLDVAGRIDAEREISGKAWFDEFSLSAMQDSRGKVPEAIENR